MIDNNGFVRSALEVDNKFQKTDAFIRRFKDYSKENKIDVEKIPLRNMRELGQNMDW